MKKGKKIALNIILGGILVCGGIFATTKVSTNTSTPQAQYEFNVSTENKTNFQDKTFKYRLFVNENEQEVVLENTTLENALKNLLGVTTLKVNSISTHEDYKETETEAGSGIFTANKNCLDLSKTGVRDITELCLFDWPSTLKAINLAENGITNDDIASIMKFPTYKANDTIQYNGKTLVSFSNFDLILAKFNLCFNDIDLTKLDTDSLNNTKFIYGIQKLNNLHSSGLVLKKELGNCYYFFREDDYVYIHPSFWQTAVGQTSGTISSYVNGAVTNITANEKYGLYQITISGDNSGTTGYFSGWASSYQFTAFTAQVAIDYFAEKLELFKLPKDKLIFDGIAPTWVLSGSPETKNVGSHQLNITIDTGNASRVIYVDYLVKDTKAPVIELIGQNHISIRETSVPFKDPGVKGLDSNGAEDISDRVQSNAYDVLEVVNGKYVKKTYVITYTLTDKAGNVATPVTRTVTVQENVLDAILIKSQTDKEKIQVGKDIVLEVKPDSNIPLDKYKDLQYYWYVDGVLQNEITVGDAFEGKSTMTFFFNTVGTREIKVILKAKDLNNNSIEVYSETFNLNVQPSLRNNDTLILAAAITVGVILIVIVIVTVVKYRKAHAKSSRKTSAYHKRDKKSSSGGNDIKVIKDFKNSSTGGNANFKPDKSQDKSNTQDKDGK